MNRYLDWWIRRGWRLRYEDPGHIELGPMCAAPGGGRNGGYGILAEEKNDASVRCQG